MLSRRKFIQRTGVMIAAPMVVPSSIFGNAEKAAPSERVTVGHIGVGNQGGHLFRMTQQVSTAQSVATSDCYKSRREGFAAACQGRAYFDFRDILDRTDIDCVIVATPDHWHLPIAMAAARSKKSAYVEKPLGLTLAQNIACEKTFKEHGVVFQYGTQQRSRKNCWQGCELVRRGVIGKIREIEVDAPNGSGGGSTAEAPIPADLGSDGFDLWVGPAPEKPYTVDRCQPPGTYFIYDYSIGYLGGWGAHPLDMMVWCSDFDLSGPLEVEGTGVIGEGIYDTVYNWDMNIRLGDIKLTFRPGGDRTRFIGEEGWIEIQRVGNLASDDALLAIPLDEESPLLTRSDHHVGNFIASIRSKTEAISNLRDAVRSDNLSQLCDMAVRTNSRVQWDPIKMELIDSTPEQRAMLDRPMRAPWTL